MTFYERYINGEDGRVVYNDIYALRQKAFEPQYFEDIKSVMRETFVRIAFNLKVIYGELINIGYVFNTDCEFNFEEPLLAPLPDTDKLLIKLENAVKEFGYVPYSLKLFYQVVGSCNFGWDYQKQPDMFWECADPIQIASLDSLVSEVSDPDWVEFITECAEDGVPPALDLAADYWHKDNISGGPAYAIQITVEPSIDAQFLNEGNETTFIDYLRICMENCGFSKITEPEFQNDYQEFFDTVKPQLKVL